MKEIDDWKHFANDKSFDSKKESDDENRITERLSLESRDIPNGRRICELDQEQQRLAVMLYLGAHGTRRWCLPR